MDMKHTPGPWRVKGCKIISATASRWTPIGDEREPITVIDGRGAMGGNDTDADARLMAAAPELLEALDDMLAAFLDAPAQHGIELDAEEKRAAEKALAAIATAVDGGRDW